jgi:hypothetical protein
MMGPGASRSLSGTLSQGSIRDSEIHKYISSNLSKNDIRKEEIK